MMKLIKICSVFFVIIVLCCEEPSNKKSLTNESTHQKEISIENLRDKIKGAWVAQTVGVTFGAPVEFKYNSTMIQDYQKLEWDEHSLINEYLQKPGTYDDIYMDLSFMKVIDEEGIDAPAMSFAKSFANADYKLWFANQTARYNIQNGLTPPRIWSLEE